jgi:hypothetical protein
MTYISEALLVECGAVFDPGGRQSEIRKLYMTPNGDLDDGVNGMG